jgi:hypothetical protein
MIILMSHSLFSMAQMFISKPYLKITNSLSGQVYKIKPNNTIEFILINDSVLQNVGIESFRDSNSIILSNGKQISIDQISYIRFKLKSKGVRITKLLFYTTWICLYTVVIYESSNSGFGQIPYCKTFIIGTTVAITIAEVGEKVFNLFIQKRELFNDKNLKLEIVTK